ncbi:hypothetical protein [Lysobacter fragariae]
MTNNSDHGSYATSWIARRWPAIRARGPLRFLLVQGLLRWGGLMFLGSLAMVWITFGPAHPRFGLLLGVAAVLCAVGSLFWAALTWLINERIYRTLENKRQSP